MSRKLFIIISSLIKPNDFEKIFRGPYWFKKNRPVKLKLNSNSLYELNIKNKKNIWVISGYELVTSLSKDMKELFKSHDKKSKVDPSKIKIFEQFLIELCKINEEEKVDLRIFIHWGGNDSIKYLELSKSLRNALTRTQFDDAIVEHFSRLNNWFYTQFIKPDLKYEEALAILEYESLVPNIDFFFKKILIHSASIEGRKIDISATENPQLYLHLEKYWRDSTEFYVFRLREALGSDLFSLFKHNLNRLSFEHPDKLKLRKELNDLLKRIRFFNDKNVNFI